MLLPVVAGGPCRGPRQVEDVSEAPLGRGGSVEIDDREFVRHVQLVDKSGVEAVGELDGVNAAGA